MLAAFHLNLTALSYIALLVGLFLVYNTVSTSVIMRREEIGTLRALGTSRARVLAMFLAEALALALPGCLLGLAFGRLLAHGALSLTQTTVSALYVATRRGAAGAGMGRRGAGVRQSACRCRCWPRRCRRSEARESTPMAAIRGADRLETRYRLRAWRLVVPAVLFALAAWLARRGTRRGPAARRLRECARARVRRGASSSRRCCSCSAVSGAA